MVKLRAILPKLFRAEDVISTVNKEAVKFGQYVKLDLERLTSKWQGEKPKWRIDPYITREGITVSVTLIDKTGKGAMKFIFIDKGTRAHDIYPVRAERLRFMSEYQAGSSPNSLFTVRAQSGGQTVYADHVRHPGTKARNWSELVAKNQQKPFERWMNAATAKALRDTGHTIKR